MNIFTPRLILYSHDTFGLGHLRRNLAISHQLAHDYPQISQLLVTGSSQVHHYPLPAELDYIKLPAIHKGSNGDYQARTLNVSLAGIVHWRANMILQAAREFEPDILLVDKAPAGMCGELRPTLDYLRRESPATRLVFGMRDIIDAPVATRREWTDEGIYSLLEETYDAIFLYGSRTFFDPIHEYDLSPRLSAKLIECGYIRRTDPIRPREEILKELQPRGEVLLVVTAGGGGDGAELVRTTLEMLSDERRKGRSTFHAFVVTGPLMSGEERAYVQSYAEQDLPLTLVEFTTDLMSYLHAADIVVSMGGYNTICEILALRQRAVIVPRATVRAEQLVRAERLAARGQARVIHPSQLTPARLLAEIHLALASPRPDPGRAGIDFKGLDRISSACGEQLNLVWPYLTLTGALSPAARLLQ